MRITRIDFEGNNHHATVTRQPGGFIEATIVFPDKPREVFAVNQANERELWGLAVRLQAILDGCAGTHSMNNAYYQELMRLAD